MIGHLKNGKIFAMHDDGAMSEVDTNTQERSLEHTLEDDLNGISFIDRIRRHQKSPEERFESALNNFVGHILGKINNEDTEEGED